ncbi:MAG: TonB-dependent receptor [Bergeyella sp.]
MKIFKLSIAVTFLISASPLLKAQSDTLQKEKKIDEVTLQGTGNKKTEASVLQEQKKSVVQKQAMGADEISRKGISNVEQGLLKITGITAVEGRGIFVRGLEERYNYLLINGLGSPSNNPFQKIIALKQFPTDVVGKLNIYKTFNSNLFGDFAGATFDIETLTIDKPFTKIEFGIGYNTRTTFKDFKIAENASGMRGYIGLNSEDRNLPAQIRDSRPNNYRFSREESLDSFKDSWNVDNIKALPNTSIGFTTAQKTKIGESGTLSFLLSLNQGNKYSYKEGANNQFRNLGQHSNEFSNFLINKQYTYETESSALLGLGYKNKGTALNFNAIFLQNSENLISDNSGYKDQQIQNLNYGFFRTNQLDISRFLDLQISGSQKIGERQQIKAGASYVINNYSQPDRKIFEGSRYDANSQSVLPDGELSLRYGGNNLIRQYLDVDSRFYGSAYAEYSVFFGQKNDRKEFPVQISLGYNGFADFRKNSYRFVHGVAPDAQNRDVIITIDTPQNVFDQSILNNHLYYMEGSDNSQYYSSIYQLVNGGYLNLNYKPSDSWDILIGGRYEKDLTLIRYSEQSATTKENLTKDHDFFLPSLSVKKALNTRNNIRFSFSKTVTRPVLIETMPIKYISPDNVSILGNPLIKTSDNYNADLKWEYFPSGKEMFSVNLFAKRIDNAIERSLTPSADATGTTITFFNAKKAEIYGVELEGILNLGRISDALEKFSLGANATIMHTNVERSEQQMKTEKPDWISENDLKKRGLQGAAPYTINADLKYEYKNPKNLNSAVSLVYNVSGEKIYATGGNGLDNYYEKPFHQLDLIFQNQFTKNWNVKLSVQNLLDSKYEIRLGENNYAPLNTNGNYTLSDYYNGINFNLNIGYTF